VKHISFRVLVRVLNSAGFYSNILCLAGVIEPAKFGEG